MAVDGGKIIFIVENNEIHSFFIGLQQALPHEAGRSGQIKHIEDRREYIVIGNKQSRILLDIVQFVRAEILFESVGDIYEKRDVDPFLPVDLDVGKLLVFVKSLAVVRR